MRNTFDAALKANPVRGVMKLRQVVGAASIMLAVVSLPGAISSVLVALGHRGGVPIWLNPPYLWLGWSVVLGLFVRFGAWRLERGVPWAWLLLASFVLGLSTPAGIALLFAPTLGSHPLDLVNALGLAGGLCLAVGILLTGLAPRWVGWTGIAGVALSTFLLRSLFSLIGQRDWFSGRSLWVMLASIGLSLVYHVALGSYLLAEPSVRVEQALRADAVS